ncbi:MULTISPECIES: hypothetical protein [unclassified Streptomyces]|uniref:hypothetical protein n=1 Tax=unclassified Streptomyces TaxID=2593676 RepID=UPI003813CFA4
MITELEITARDGIDEELRLVAVHPGVSAEQVRVATGWDLRVAETARQAPGPAHQDEDPGSRR